MGLMAASTDGFFAICQAPSTPSTTNQTSITGPNNRPTSAVPRACSMKRATRMIRDNGRTNGVKAGAAADRPSTALITETAGVIMASP